MAIDFQAKLVAGYDRPAELDPIDRGDQGNPARRQVDAGGDQDAGGLAIASTMSTPGMIGSPGQWPAKNGSLMLTFLIGHGPAPGARARAPGRPAGTDNGAAASS